MRTKRQSHMVVNAADLIADVAHAGEAITTVEHRRQIAER